MQLNARRSSSSPAATAAASASPTVACPPRRAGRAFSASSVRLEQVVFALAFYLMFHIAFLAASQALAASSADAKLELACRRDPTAAECPSGSHVLDKEAAMVESIEQSLLQARSWRINGREAVPGMPDPSDAAAMLGSPTQPAVPLGGGKSKEEQASQQPHSQMRERSFTEMVQAELMSAEQEVNEELRQQARAQAQTQQLWQQQATQGLSPPVASPGDAAHPIGARAHAAGVAPPNAGAAATFAGAGVATQNMLWRPGTPKLSWSPPGSLSQGPAWQSVPVMQAAPQPNVALFQQAPGQAGVLEQQQGMQQPTSQVFWRPPRMAAQEEDGAFREASFASMPPMATTYQRSQQEAARVAQRPREIALFQERRHRDSQVPDANAVNPDPAVVAGSDPGVVAGSTTTLQSTNSSTQSGEPIEIAMPTNCTGKCKSKVVLLLIQIFGFSLCGVDRCYLGGACLGVVKALTLAGFGIWGIVDWILITQNALEMKADINAFGMKASFTPESLTGAKPLALIFVIIGVLQIYAGSHMPRQMMSMTARMRGGRLDGD